ncbi:MAG: CDP-archaeol synthase [Candidatus Nealsonbacteria bacterium]|nr:CDP-archaeol synthase [Candidatus Nealsonbacteria bacterium]
MNFQFIISCLYFFLPAYFTNMVPPLIRRANLFNFLDKPVDFDKKFLGKPFLGTHKTWRGVICGVILGMIIVWIQVWLYRFPSIKEISFIDYRRPDIWLFAFLISAGAVFGDLLFAFIKRRVNITPGGMFMPFDQTNYVVGVALFLTPLLSFNIMVWITLFIATFLLHIVFNRIGYLLGLHKNKW